ncbi:bifunctional diguanylate cyclase/phosphodiesterase [Sphingosinicella sp. CPCC 101087]|uniref:putative bifunctional diguanylate cyclase/phosphodiesterase n=1 Tax=Sphingosinicella sp. CPCC 101087 TaxID=2497754 RepID=UPI00101E105E|nr:EAL domain-containing protein [Sphingosinicella sp. CPCC 101087]
MTRALFRSPWKALLLALFVGFAFGIGQIGEPIENIMQAARFKLRSHPASGSIVLVAIDDRSVAEIGKVPWNGGQLAGLVQRLDAAGARRLHLDSDFAELGSPAQAAQLESALSNLRAELLLPARFSIDLVTGARSDHLPPARFARHARLVNTNLFVWWDGAVWQHPEGAIVGGRLLPSLGSVLGRSDQISTDLFHIDYAADVRSLTVVSASDILNGRIRPQLLAGKDVVVGRTDFGAEHHRVPGATHAPAILFHLAAAETLLSGRPVNLGWGLPLVLGLFLSAALLQLRRRWIAVTLLSAAAAAAIAGPIMLEEQQIHVQIIPAMAAIITAALIRLVASLRRSYQTRGTTNIVTGMPNLQALQRSQLNGGVVVAARVKNYAQITATLPPQQEKELVEQIVARLEFGAGGATTYQADQGVFVWVADNNMGDGVIQQLEGLQALFRSPIVIETRLIDLSITFGLDVDGSRPLAQRASSALVAADDAAREGKRWASFNPASVEDADWSMSLLARLDHAIDNDELWVAYQPKIDCRSGRVVGAEALVRWTHPEKGQVYPDQFIAAAEQGGRIERLTYFVLDNALASAARINGRRRRFSIAVNLSVLLLDSENLVPTVEALLARYNLAPQLLTLEVTETSTLASGAAQIANLERLSRMGVQLSIDDYGTGFSTLEYLKRIPASEIKIDRSFISMLNKSQSDRIMVNSTIQLAHSLGRKVVAEGVENEDILRELKRMRCDIVQGFHTGRPVPIAELIEQFGLNRPSRAA